MTALKLQAVHLPEKESNLTSLNKISFNERCINYAKKINIKPAPFRVRNSKKENIGLFIIQASPFCNINCKYCYLPDRGNRNVMSDVVLDLCFKRLFETDRIGDVITIAWHAGEPLTVPIEFYEKAIAISIKYKPDSVEVVHSIQTNAIPITQAWCDFIKKNKIKIGVSIDGPEVLHDENRVTHKGKGTFKKTMKGIALLKKNKIDFSVISVLTARSLEFPDEMFDFLCSIGASYVGLNVDEAENDHNVSSLEGKEIFLKYQKFMYRFFSRIVNHKGEMPYFREYKYTQNKLIGVADNVSLENNNENTPFPMVSVDYNGDFCTFSPELLGQNVAPYGSWVFGNVKDNSFEEMTENKAFRQVWSDIKKGIDSCKKECDYFDVCGGGAPSNKLGECGSLEATKTNYCHLTVDCNLDMLLKVNAI